MNHVLLVLALGLCGTSTLPAQSIDDVLRKDRSGPLICGHRGGFYRDLPENSLSAIDNTVTRSAPSPVIVEVDVRKSADGSLFVLHDRSVDRTTNGQGNISALSDSYVNSLLVRKPDGELSDQKILTLDALLQYAGTRNVLLMLDVKGDAWPDTIQKLAERKLASRSIVLTFTPADSLKVYGLSRDVKISCLVRNDHDWKAVKALAIPNEQLIAYVDSNTDRTLIGQLRGAGIPVMTDVSENATNRTSPFPREFYTELVRSTGIDILITDFPVDVLRMFDRSRR
jgi:glycerophosphoryl diester phosphodiesterase